MPPDIKTRVITRDIKAFDRASLLPKTANRIKENTRLERLSESGSSRSAWAQADEESARIARKGKDTARSANVYALRTKNQAKRVSQRAVRGKVEGRAVGVASSSAKSRTVQGAHKVARNTRCAGAASNNAMKSNAVRKMRTKAVRQAKKGTRSFSFMLRRSASAIARFARMAILQTRALMAALALGGASAAAVVVIVCLIGLLMASAFGIFFAGGDLGDGSPTLRNEIALIEQEHTQRVEEARNGQTYDEVSITGSKAPWKEVLAIYSVMVTTDTDNPQVSLTINEANKAKLREVFWEANQIETEIKEREYTEIVIEEDESGNPIETTKTYTRKVLHINLSAKSFDELIAARSFSQEQIELAKQLVDPQFDSAWRSVLYGVIGNAGDLVEVAESQLGNVGGRPYWSWYGFSGRVEWCACFVSWCANECGYIEAGAIPKFSYCPTGVQWFKDAGRWAGRGINPEPGAIIFFDWNGDGISDHVGIVESCDGSTVHTIEGNTSDSCARRSYNINSSYILGYGIVKQSI